MKAYIVYTDDGMIDAVVSDSNYDEFWDMVYNNGWNADEVSK